MCSRGSVLKTRILIQESQRIHHGRWDNLQMVTARIYPGCDRKAVGRSGIRAIREKTSCPVDINPNEPLSIFIINKLVPRGSAFEALKRGPAIYDKTSHALHDAIRKGLS